MTRRATAWVIDDSAFGRDQARLTLEADFDVETFPDGAPALEAIVERPPDLVVLDWELPGVGGVDVCRFLRARPATAALPVLVLTVRSTTADLVAALEAGADDFVTKPFAPAELRARASALVRGREAHAGSLRAERALREIFEQLGDAIVVCGPDGTLRYANPQAERVLDGSTALTGRNLGDLWPELAALLPGAHRDRTLPDLKRRGAVYAPQVREIPLGPLPTTLVVLRDVTEERRQDLRRVDFYSMVAHDLRSPLGALLLRTDVMLTSQDGSVTPSTAEHLTKMRRQLLKMSELINDFLELGRIDGVGLELARESVQTSSLLNDVIDDVQPLLRERRQMVTSEVDSSSERLVVDRRRIARALVNLVANAVKYSAEGGHVHIQVVGTGEEVELSVTDTGPGIAAGVLPGLFQRYARGDVSTTVQGTGLGLLIVREIVEAHGGTVGVESELGRGSRFWIRLPQPRAEVAALASSGGRAGGIVF
jgi:two-component system phosphate regulon sensor histidine kinase PhoR